MSEKCVRKIYTVVKCGHSAIPELESYYDEKQAWIVAGEIMLAYDTGSSYQMLSPESRKRLRDGLRRESVAVISDELDAWGRTVSTLGIRERWVYVVSQQLYGGIEGVTTW